VMFAQGNREERARMGRLVREKERVADLCAGIGYFTIPMAVSGACVHAMELNPVSYRYLEQNITDNHLEELVVASCGDCRELLHGTYDRMVLGHFESLAFLPAALRHARPGSVLHVHSIGSIEDEIRSLASAAGFSAAISLRRVKKYSPGNDHIVADVVLS
jgi:tRNA wybutosine-synthesizing protein 2